MNNQILAIKRKLDQLIGADFPIIELEKLLPSASIASYEVDEYFVRAGETTRKVGFVVSGLFRLFYTDYDGKDFTKNFRSSGHFVGAQASLLLKVPSRLNIQALEPSSILCLDYDEILRIAEDNFHWQRLLRKITELDYLEKEQRESDLLFYHATERYLNFKKEHPNWDAQVQLRYIASYLGMSPETLSRIRKNINSAD
ncbi:MAG: Crp/Fnr family transcriptional regulator [Defluviitaleaceae bacterium]|nr:Crp/Fnr family transcriptional regulator [Defluviitaleaceae bacterium]